MYSADESADENPCRPFGTLLESSRLPSTYVLG
jgi:hypothetical protein